MAPLMLKEFIRWHLLFKSIFIYIVISIVVSLYYDNSIETINDLEDASTRQIGNITKLPIDSKSFDLIMKRLNYIKAVDEKGGYYHKEYPNVFCMNLIFPQIIFRFSTVNVSYIEMNGFVIDLKVNAYEKYF